MLVKHSLDSNEKGLNIEFKGVDCMASVTGRIKEVKQPRGGFLKPSEFTIEVLDDGFALNEEENVHGSVIGMAVDYLTRFIKDNDVVDAFKISLQGAGLAEELGLKNAKNIAVSLLSGIKSFDDDSIINACKLVTFDAWYRNPMGAIMAKGYNETNPDKATIENIRILVNRSLNFFNKYGPVLKYGFTFDPKETDEKARFEMMVKGKGTYGGYTATVQVGDGDFLTKDTLWDLKVSKSKPTSKHTLQLIMYWVMGQHSGQEIYKDISKLGIFNPRLNTVYTYNISKLSKDIISTIEKEIICY